MRCLLSTYARTLVAAGRRAFQLHALRHFAVSYCKEQKLQPKTVQTYVDHATLQMTMDTYGHMFPSDDHAKAMDAIAKELFS
ncbi:Phage integrase family protein [Bradyrhizobium shewense]|uniref:Phage integrase family protein n=1 Tax=Bradyrhizobium shewense TaxID=1761772 RepID=A0A1C3WCE3_9BRAD|nr:Phage integrase family protein [Bradyrhizobium shewense]